MKREDQAQLLRFVGCSKLTRPADAAGPVALTAAATAPDADPDPQSYEDAIESLRLRLLADPRGTLANAPATLGYRPTVADFLRMLKEAEDALDAPRLTLRKMVEDMGVEAAVDEPSVVCQSTGEQIPLKPNNRQFEKSDPRWVLTGIEAASNRMFRRKAALAPLATFDSFRYPLRENAGVASVALFSDWGTGLPHSQLIACDITARHPGQAVHLGDVYYIGDSNAFEVRCKDVLKMGMLQGMPVFSLNANHEMDSNGRPYFAFLDWKRTQAAALGFAPQPQESSYFCLSNDSYQLIAIDTAYSSTGTLAEHTYFWLKAQLQRGRAEKKVNILLSQNEPYVPGDYPQRDLLAVYVNNVRDLIDMWFWGDEHYAGLWGPRGDIPFYGSCIGHGGYPYAVMDKDSDFATPLVPTLWCEKNYRMASRKDRGNNGYAWLDLTPDLLTVIYIDWMGRDAGTRSWPVANGKLGTPA